MDCTKTRGVPGEDVQTDDSLHQYDSPDRISFRSSKQTLLCDTTFQKSKEETGLQLNRKRPGHGITLNSFVILLVVVVLTVYFSTEGTQAEEIQQTMNAFTTMTDAKSQSSDDNSLPESQTIPEENPNATNGNITIAELTADKTAHGTANMTYMSFPNTSQPNVTSPPHRSTNDIDTSNKYSMQVKSTSTPTLQTISRGNACNSSDFVYYWIKLTFQGPVWNNNLNDRKSYEFQSTSKLLTTAMMRAISESKYNQDICSFTVQGYSIGFQDNDEVNDVYTPTVVAEGLVQGISNSSLNEEDMLHIVTSVQIENFGHNPSRGRVKRYATLDELISTTPTVHLDSNTTFVKTSTDNMTTKKATITSIPAKVTEQLITKSGTTQWAFHDITRTATVKTPLSQSCSNSDLEVKLSEGAYGRLEIKRKNCPSDSWGTVCDDMWDILDATIVCRQLGYPDTTPVYAYRGAFFGEGVGYIWANRFDCKGTETDISQCSFQGWGNIHCSHIQDAGLSCGQEFTMNTTAMTSLPPSKTTNKYIPTTPPYYSSQIRLVNGSNCLEGRVEVYYNGEWGTVCDDGWDFYDAVVVCRMLGYSTVGAKAVCCAGFSSNYNLDIFLDDVQCSGYESSIYNCGHNGWYSHNCNHYEDAGVRCGGSINQCVSAIPSVNCTFDTSSCSYATTALSGTAVWNFGHSYFANPLSGVAYYMNSDGFETDMAYLKSPEFAVNTNSSYSIEFYYWINESVGNALSAFISVDDVTRSVWEIPSLHREEEETWMYQCVNVGELQTSSIVSVSFLAKRGNQRTRIIAIDNVAFGSKTCRYGLQAGICDFEQPSVAGYSINCTNCKTSAPLFRWHWTKGSTPSNGTGPNVDNTFGNDTGRYMYAEATYGLEGDATALIFPDVNTSMTYRSIQFFYHMYGREIGTLRVALESNNRETIIWQKSGGQENVWKRDCVELPADSKVRIKFVAVKGAGPLGDIAVDDIRLLTTLCPHIISCLKTFKECGYSRTSSSSNYTWGWNGETSVPSSQRECNFENGSCNFTYDYWKKVNAPWTSFWGVTFIDPTYSNSGEFMVIQGSNFESGYMYTAPVPVDTVDCELSFLYSYYTTSYFYVMLYQHSKNGSQFYLSQDYYMYNNTSNIWNKRTVMLQRMKEMAFISIYVSGYQFAFAVDEIRFSNCDASSETAEGELAELSSPAFSHLGGKQFLTFYHTIASNDVIQVLLRGQSENNTKINENLVTLNLFVDEDELVCINLPDVVGTMNVVFQARKGDNQIKETATSASISNIDLLEGQCPDTLDLHNCTFEADHVLCGLVVSTPGTSICDTAAYRWMRHSGPTLTDGAGPSKDHTMEIYGTADSGLKAPGYYMYADASFGNQGDTTTLQLKEFTVGKFCSMEFFYHMRGSSDQNLFVMETFRKQTILFRSRNVDVWIPGCIMLKNDCNLDNNSTRNIQFLAQRGATPYGDIAIDDISLSHDRCPEHSIACDFEDSMCGYVGEPGWVWIRSSNGSYLRTEELSSKLVFPPTRGPSCISLFYSATDLRPIMNRTNLSLYIGGYEYPIQVDGKRRIINVLMTSEMSYMEMYIASDIYIRSVFMLYNVTYSSSCPPLECQAGEFSCQNYCIYDNQVCDGQIHNCWNGEDENEITCPIQVSCNFNRRYLCGYSFFMVYPVVENDTDTLNTYISFRSYNQLAYAESPVRHYSRKSCLRYRYYQEGDGWHRVAANFSSFLSDIVLFSDDLKAKQWTKVQMNLPTGEYSIIFEFNTDSFSSEARIDDVKIMDGPCENDSISCNNETEFECNISLWNDDIIGICLSSDLKCDRKLDCRGGTDERECPLNVTCNFENGLCGYYDKSDSYKYGWRREKAPFAIGTNRLYDQTFGLAGSFMVVGSIDLYSFIDDELVSPNFTSYSYVCQLHYSIAYYVENYMNMYINLYNKDGYVEQQYNIYGKEQREVIWQEMSLRIPMGQYHVGFYASGWGFVLAIDNVHISECTPKSSCDVDTEFNCQMSTDNGVMSVCLHKSAQCDRYIDCLDGVDEENCSSNITCDFDDGLCGYNNNRKIYRNAWRGENAPYMMGNTSLYDPKFGLTGSFMVAGSSYDSLSSDVVLLSPNFTSFNYMCQLNYSVAVYGNSYMKMTVILYNTDGHGTDLDYVYISSGSQVTWQERSVRIPIGQYYIGFYVYGSKFEIALDAVHISNCDPQSSCDIDTEFRCHAANKDGILNICLQKTSVCDRYSDCINGTDEQNCLVNATCDFEEGLCGYYNKYKYGYNIWRLVEAPYMMGNNTIYDLKFGADGSFMVAESKNPSTGTSFDLITANFSSLNSNCRLSYSINFIVNGYIEMYVYLYDENGFAKQLDYMYNSSLYVASWNERSLDIPVGHFYIEFFVYGWGYQLALDNVYLSNCAAKASCSNGTEYSCQISTETGDVSVCLLRESLCDHNIDCKNGEDETYCNFSVSCQFEETDVCGYHNATGNSYFTWARVAAPYYLYNTYMYDTVFGSSGHFMYAGSDAYAYEELYAPYFTVTSSDCQLHYSAAFYVNIYFSFSVNLNNRNGYVTHLDDIYGSYDERPIWKNRSINIQYVGQFYLTFAISGWSFHFLLDNVYLSNCNASCDVDTEFHCQITSKIGVMNVCLHKSAQCDRYIDCLDGLDEENCSSNITCDFDDGLCGYNNNKTLYRNAWRGENAPYMMGNTTLYDPKFGLTGSFMVVGSSYVSMSSDVALLSPNFTSYNYMCQLNYSVAYYVDSYMRMNVILYNKDGHVTDLDYIYTSSRSHVIWQERTVRIPIGQYYIGFYVNGWNFELALDAVHFSNCDPQSSCDVNTEFECQISTDNEVMNVCLHKSAQCDRYIDCLDGVDEENCSSNITCDFDDGLCGYNNSEKIYKNAWRGENAPYMMGNTSLYDPKFGFTGSFMVVGSYYDSLNSDVALLSPNFTSYNYMCQLNYSVAYYVDSYMRLNVILYNKDGHVTDLDYIYTSSGSQVTWQERSVRIPIGQYYIGFYVHGSNFELAFDAVYISNCDPQSSCDIDTEFLCHVANEDGILTLCLQKTSLCDHYSDCINGTDEQNCLVNATCDFEEGLCGYYNKYKYEYNIWRLVEAPYMMGNNTINDQTFGSDGSFMVVESKNPSMWSNFELISANFSSLNSNCRLSYSINFNVIDYMAMSVYLYDENGFVKQLDYMYNSSLYAASWNERSLDIPVGHFYIAFFLYGSGFELALDNIYLSNCAAKATCSNETEYSCQISTETGDVSVCLLRESLCDHNIDCKNEEDETYCNFSVSCQFEETNGCGYHNANGNLNDSWTLVAAPYYLNNTYMYDTVFGSSGHFMYAGRDAYAYEELYSPYFTITSSDCYLHYSVAFYANNGFSFSVNLNNRNGFVTQIDDIYGSYDVSLVWKNRSIKIQYVGQFYLTFSISGSSFHLLLDNVYLFNCNGTTNISTTVSSTINSTSTLPVQEDSTYATFTTEPITSPITASSGDCVLNPVQACTERGFEYVTMTNIRGITNVTDAFNILRKYEIYANNLLGMPCTDPGLTLYCGWYTTACQNGERRPVCRESCEYISLGCGDWTSYLGLKNSAEVLGYYCKFLPYLREEPDCLNINVSAITIPIQNEREHKKTIEDVRLIGGTEEYNGRVEVKLNGVWGTICGNLNYAATALLCQFMGFSLPAQIMYGSTYGSGPDHVISNIECEMKEKDINNCTIEYYKGCYWYEENMGLQCTPSSVSCTFEHSTCGYNGDYWILDTNTGGMTLSQSAKEDTTAFLRSPVFLLRYSGSIAFKYRINRATKGAFGLNIEFDGGKERPFSIKADYDGIFSECVELTYHPDRKLQLVFYVNRGQPLDRTNLTITLLEVILQQTGCQKDMCTFESFNSCSFSYECHDQNEYRFQLTAGKVFSPFTGPDADHTYGNITGHYMLADASYGTAGDSASFSVYIYFEKTENLFLRFFYYLNGQNVESLEVFFQLEESNENNIYKTLIGDHGPSWQLSCTVLDIFKAGKYVLVFKATRGNGTQGDIAIDDITVTTTPCPHPVSCDFEGRFTCGYIINSSAYYWESTKSYVLNVLGHLDGYHMQAVSDSSVEGDRAVIQSPTFKLTTSTKCVFFQFYLAGNDVGRLSVTISYDNGTKTEQEFYISGNQGNEWFLANVPLNYTGYNNASVIFTAFQGQNGNSVIALDDIVVSEKNCISGIQHDTCDFDSPFTGAYQSDCSYNSQYQWTRQVGPSQTSGTGPQFDANGDPGGAYLIADSSFGAENHYSIVSFPAIKTSSTTKLTFYHHMYGHDDQVADLSVLFATESAFSVLADFCCNNGGMWKFKCIPLPSTSRGVLHFKAKRKKGVFGDVALDKIGLLDGDCPGISVACDFDHTDFICGYQGTWTRIRDGSNYFMRSSGNDRLRSPSSTLNESTCITFNYQLQANDFTSELIIILHYELNATRKFETKLLFNLTGHQGPLWKKGQIQVNEEGTMSFYIQFESSGAGMFSVDNISITTGVCKPLECTFDEFNCLEKCIPSMKECDKKADCVLGEDEARSCHPDIICNFETSYHCGYRNVSSTDQWNWVDLRSSTLADDGIFGHVLLANPSYYTTMSLQSPVVKIKENKCLRFSYYSTGVLTVSLDLVSQTEWVDNTSNKYWRSGQVNVSPGDVSVYFRARRYKPYDQGAVVAIDNIKLLNGTCMEHKPECPGTMIPCEDNYKCVDKEHLCDLEWDCFDGSDESRKNCNVSIQCNFETKSRCGYKNISAAGTPWNHTTGSLFQIPQFDRTYGTQEGHFMVVSNRQDPMDYFGGNINSFLMLNNNASLISPTEEIESESCVEFYYYLNGSAVRPNPLSAQLLVYVKSGNQKTLLWYDHVNRTISGWLKGWVPVPKGSVSVVFEAKTSITSAIWPGVVALDEVSLKNETCSQSLHCGLDTFRCTISRVCIPVYLQCDGGNDCTDGSDEDSCNNKPDFEVMLVDGDMSYGSVAIFYQGRWIPVCLGYDGDLIASLACKQLGYYGRYRSGIAYSWHKPVTQTMYVTCQYTHTNLSQCSMYGTYSTCRSYQAVLCSNTECFSGERICPMSTKCVPVQYFCDGIPDCPSAEDEKNCAKCNSSAFECANHQCILDSQRCDGTAQCKDASDEYRCVIIDDRNGSISIFHAGSNYLPLCSENMTSVLASILCKISGRGTASMYNSAQKAVNGLALSADSTVSGTLLPGYRTSIDTCYPMEIQCQLIECGTTSLTDEVILPKILFGREATLGQFPWQIALFQYGSFRCGGSIIHPNWVLTAAHCIVYFSSEYSIRMGTVSLTDASQGQEKMVSRIYSHPEYSSYDLSYDIGLLYFSTPIVMNDYVRPVCLSFQSFYQDLLHQGPNAECYISGWGLTEEFVLGDGRTDNLLMTKVHLITSDECKDSFSFSIQDTVVCVNNENIGEPACFGDSGGPLVCRNKYGRLQLVGITSFGSAGTCTRDVPNGYQLVHPYLNWINSITGLNFTNFDF